ncbi:vitamin B12-dependent ribonucleotide reductase [bacterium]|nr:vitamin B12-dependent ribonucleotide reductase [candidate division CSSED10-310 bacterium]
MEEPAVRGGSHADNQRSASPDAVFPADDALTVSRPDDFAIELSENARVVLKKRYLRKDEEGKVIETPVELFRRAARAIAMAERKFLNEQEAHDWEERFFRMMARMDFMPNSPTLMNAGRETQQLSACFVLPVEDSIDSIFNTIRDTALIHKSGGGTGFSFSGIRPKDDRVRTTNGVASGPVSFMSVFDSATEAVKQGGTRRGANMAILKVDHPDIMEFITCKDDTGKLKNFNISVALTDSFMEAVKNDAEYPLINPRTGQIQSNLDARKVFDLIVHQAWKNGEPGVIFLDRINADNPTPHVGAIQSTNPCGEQPLLPYESCNLGSINLAKMVADRKGSVDVDYTHLKEAIRVAVRFLDDVIEVNQFPLSEISEKTLANRKIGLGVMGFADLLIRMGIRYDSEEALKLASDVMSFIRTEANRASRELARERGAFPNFKGSKWDRHDRKPIRNATVTTIAPTGSISIIAGCSSGIEPLFSIVFKRRILDGEELLDVHPLFLDHAREQGFYSKDLIRKISRTSSLKDIPEIPAHTRNLFVTSHDVTPEWHVRMQAAFQKFTDNAVSKTINFAESAAEEDVREAYMLAYRSGCKGITVYRDGSRENQVLSTGSTRDRKTGQGKSTTITPRPRPSAMVGQTIEMQTGCGSLYVTINEDMEGRPFELFAQIGKAGGCVASQTQSTARLISLALRSNIDPMNVVKQLIGISCHKQKGYGQNKTLSCSDAIAKALQWYLHNQSNRNPQITYNRERGACPDCGGVIEHINGCETCRSCGYSECG